MASLFSQANLNDKTIELYKHAITLSDSEPQYREYLSELLSKFKGTEEAFAAWQEVPDDLFAQ